jgi:hypothetical protein
MTIAEQIYEKVKGLPEEEQAEILSLVDLRTRKVSSAGRISTLGLIGSKGKPAAWEDFQEARQEAWRGLGDLPGE